MPTDTGEQSLDLIVYVHVVPEPLLDLCHAYTLPLTHRLITPAPPLTHSEPKLSLHPILPS